MMTYACPKCGQTINSPESEAGNLLDCPGCHAEVRVPAVRSSGSAVAWIVGITAVVLGGCVALSLIIVVCLTAIQFLGTQASTTFSTVGQSLSDVNS